MDPENTETNTSTETPTGDASQSVDVTATPEFRAAVEAEAKRAHDAAYAKARREFEARSKGGEQPKSKAADAMTAPPAVTGDRAFEDSLADALAEQKSLTKEQRGLVRKLVRNEKPENVDAYVAQVAAMFGPAPAVAAGNHATNNAAKPAPVPNSAPAAPAPSSTVPGDGPERILRYDESMIRNYLGRNGGGDPANPMHWSNRKASIELAKRLEADMANTRLIPRQR